MQIDILVSIIIPVYNVEQYISKCIESVIVQSYKKLEIILINDGSSDSSGEICDFYSRKDSRIQVFHKQNGGASSARNFGLNKASGEYFSFIDADDYVSPNYIETLLQYDADVVISKTNLHQKVDLNFIKKTYHLHRAFISPCGRIFKTSKVGHIRFREDVDIGEDRIYNLEVIRNIQSAYFIKYNGYHINQLNSTSLTRINNGHYTKRWDDEYQIWWENLFFTELKKTGIILDDYYRNTSSITFCQKIKNLCYTDCPHSFKEKIRRIQKILETNKKNIYSIKKSISPKTLFIAKNCIRTNSPLITYLLFKLMLICKIFR